MKFIEKIDSFRDSIVARIEAIPELPGTLQAIAVSAAIATLALFPFANDGNAASRAMLATAAVVTIATLAHKLIEKITTHAKEATDEKTQH